MKKFLKITLIVIVVGFTGLLALGAFVSSQQKEAAEQAGFDSVDEYKKAQNENIETKAEYDAFVQRQAEIDAKAAQDGGFLSVDEYKDALAVNMPTKELYDRYLVQQAENKLAADRKKLADDTETERESKARESSISKTDDTDLIQGVGANKNMEILFGNLEYPPMGSVYSEVESICENKPSSSRNEVEHYSCGGKVKDNSFRISLSVAYVFGPDKRLKSRFFSFRNESTDEHFISDKEILQVLDARYGERSITQSGKNRFKYQNQETTYTAVSYGCNAYYTDKPGMDIPGGRPKTHQPIWVETGYNPSFIDDERYGFEVNKNEVSGVKRCVVALVNYGGTNIPRGIDEEQKYKAEVHVLEVDPKFTLLNTKYW